MDPELDKLYSMLDKADAAGAQKDAFDIAALVREHKARGPSAPTAPAQPAPTAPAQPVPSVQSNRGETFHKGQSFADKLFKGVDRLPNLVGIGNVSSGFTKADVSPQEAASRLGSGAAKSIYATARAATDTLGPVDDAVIAGLSEMTTRDKENFFEKVARSQQQAKQLRKEEGGASLVGDVIGFGVGGAGLGKAGIKGVAKQSAYLAGGKALLENPTNPIGAAQDAAISAVFGKTLEGVGNAVVKPVASYIVPRAERFLAKGPKKGEAPEPGAKGSEEFKLSESQVQRVANRVKEPVADVRAKLDEYVKVNGTDANILAIVGDDSADAFGKLSRSKKAAAQVFQKSEVDALEALPERVAGAVKRTGQTRTTTGALDDLSQRGDNAVNRTTAQADEAAAGFKAQTTAEQRTIDDQAEAASRRVADAAKAKQQGITDTALDAQRATSAGAVAEQRAISQGATAGKRTVRDEAKAAVVANEAKIDASAAKLSASIQKRAKGIKTDDTLEADLKAHTDNIMHGKGGLAEKEITLPKSFLDEHFPENPTATAAVLRAKADTLPAGEARQRLTKAIDSMTGGTTQGAAGAGTTTTADKGWSDLALTLDDVDTLRRTLSKPVDVAGVKYNLTKAGKALRDFAAEKYPKYGTDYLAYFSNAKKALETRAAAAGVLGGGAGEAAGNVALKVGQQTTPEAISAVQQGARDGALRAIAATTKDGAQTIKAAVNILRNGKEIIALAGTEGRGLVKTVHDTMRNIHKIQTEIADIQLAARTTRESIADTAAARSASVADDATRAAQRVADNATDASRRVGERAQTAQRRISDRQSDMKRALTDKQVERIKTLERAAKAQVDAIKAAMARSERAIKAAGNILRTTEGEFAAATAGQRGPLGSVARGSIADKAGQSPKDAVGVIQDLTTPSTGRKIAGVAGKDTADTLAAVGRTNKQELTNLERAAARPKDNGPIGEEVSLAMEAIATLSGRPGPGFVTAMVKRGVASLHSFGISNKSAKAIAQAVLNTDRAFVEKMLNRLAKTESQRKVIAAAIKSFAVSVAASSTANAR